MGREIKDSPAQNKLLIIRGVEIQVGQIVPILQHYGCAGLDGQVYEIDPKNYSYQIVCNTCKRGGVILDVRSLVNKG